MLSCRQEDRVFKKDFLATLLVLYAHVPDDVAMSVKVKIEALIDSYESEIRRLRKK